LKEIILKAASENLGKRYKLTRKKRIMNWNDEIASIINNGKQTYLKFLNIKPDQDKPGYKKRCAMSRRGVK
jgi:hypothetical protein